MQTVVQIKRSAEEETARRINENNAYKRNKTKPWYI